MTDADPPAELDEVVITGQRRQPNGLFPAPSGGGGGLPGDDGGIHQDELDPDNPGPGPSPPDPCSNPDTALDWNADAAAAEALRRMLETVAALDDSTHHLANREYGAMICEQSDGTLSISPIQWGDPTFDENGTWLNPGVQPTVEVNFNACGAGSLPLAMIHSHPSTGVGGGVPSANDVTWVAAINAARGDNLGRIYLVSIGDAATPYRIWVYDETNAEDASLSGEPKDEVNPEGEPCPGQGIT